jgi:hypothetical protein
MATAHKVMVTTTKSNGQQKVWPYATADTNTTFMTNPAGSSEQVLSGDDCFITDYVHSTQGTCTKVYVYFNGALQPIVLFTAAAQPTVNRQVRSCPILVPGGTKVSFATIT